MKFVGSLEKTLKKGGHTMKVRFHQNFLWKMCNNGSISRRETEKYLLRVGFYNVVTLSSYLCLVPNPSFHFKSINPTPVGRIHIIRDPPTPNPARYNLDDNQGEGQGLTFS